MRRACRRSGVSKAHDNDARALADDGRASNVQRRRIRGRGAPRGRVRRHQGGGLLRKASERARGGFRGGGRVVYRRLRGLRPPPRRSVPRAPRGSRGDGRRRGPQRRRALPDQLQARASRPLLRVGHRGRHRRPRHAPLQHQRRASVQTLHGGGSIPRRRARLRLRGGRPARARVLRHHRPRPLRKQTHRLRDHRRRVRAHGARAQSPPRQLPRAVVRPLPPPRARLRARRRTRARRTETIRSRETRPGTRHRGLHDGGQRTAVSRTARAGVSHRSGLSRRVRRVSFHRVREENDARRRRVRIGGWFVRGGERTRRGRRPSRIGRDGTRATSVRDVPRAARGGGYRRVRANGARRGFVGGGRRGTRTATTTTPVAIVRATRDVARPVRRRRRARSAARFEPVDASWTEAFG